MQQNKWTLTSGRGRVLSGATVDFAVLTTKEGLPAQGKDSTQRGVFLGTLLKWLRAVVSITLNLLALNGLTGRTGTD